MKNKPKKAFAFGLLLLLASPLVSYFGNAHDLTNQRRLFLEKYGEEQIHEFLYFGFRWDIIALIVFSVSVILVGFGVSSGLRKARQFKETNANQKPPN